MKKQNKFTRQDWTVIANASWKKLCRGEAAKFARLSESASLKKIIWLTIMEKYLLNSWIYLSYTLRWIKIALKIIKAGVYSYFWRIAPASIYLPCRVNWRTNIIIFSCHVLVIVL